MTDNAKLIEKLETEFPMLISKQDKDLRTEIIVALSQSAQEIQRLTEDVRVLGLECSDYEHERVQASIAENQSQADIQTLKDELAKEKDYSQHYEGLYHKVAAECADLAAKPVGTVADLIEGMSFPAEQAPYGGSMVVLADEVRGLLSQPQPLHAEEVKP
jgi:hypothetical protein